MKAVAPNNERVIDNHAQLGRLITLSCLLAWMLLFVTGFARAAVLVTVDDHYGIPQSEPLLVEPLGVLENDTLDGENAGENGVTAILVTGVINGTLTCPGVGPGLCPDGSFEYTPGDSFDGADSFVYQAVSATETSVPTTVTLSACSGGPLIFSCWNETAYLEMLAALGYSTFQESFEGAVWDVARSPDSVSSVVSQGIVWTSNHTATNNITTGSGPARTGDYGVFDPLHGVATGTETECDIDNPPEHCLYYDGFSGATLPGAAALHGVSGYITGISGAKPSIILDGTTQVIFGPVFGFQFIGVIDTSVAGFTSFEFREISGKIGQALYIWGDDFTLVGTPFFADGDVAPLGQPDGIIDAGDYLVMQRFALGEITPTELDLSHGDIYPPGAPDGVINIQDLVLHNVAHGIAVH